MNLIRRTVRWLINYYENSSVVSVTDFDKIAGSVSLKGVRIYGNVQIDEGAKLGRGITIRGNVKIGRFTSVNGPNSDIRSSVNEVKIGNFCSIARNVAIQEFDHYYDRASTYYVHQNIFQQSINLDISSKGSIEIGNDVWIGTQCVILSGSRIGNGAVVAANSVVNGYIPPYAIVAGSPARVIKYRFDKEVIEALEDLQWWNWPIEKIVANKSFFSSKLNLSLFEGII